jgi:phosphoribosylamine--glycine ligase
VPICCEGSQLGKSRINVKKDYSMNILVVGSGGREHALCWAIAKSEHCHALYCAPGNAGIAAVATCVDIGVEELDRIRAFVQEKHIDFVVIGPEAPLVLGLADVLKKDGVLVFGPSASAARIEGSKGFMKDLLDRCNVPTAWYGRFTNPEEAKAYVAEKGAPIVVKADGLAAGKGVILCDSIAAAHAAIDDIMVDKSFGDAGAEVVVEEFLNGEEASFFALVDGETAIPLGAAQDHKAVGEGDTGPNTGGMGAYMPAPIVDDAMTQKIMDTIINPTVKGMADAGYPFTGVLFAGLMIENGTPKTLEFNVRFGDPECQVLMARLESDVLIALKAAAEGKLNEITLKWRQDAAMVVVMAAEGYPGAYQKGTEIKNLAAADALDGVTVFHAGTKQDGDKVLATGGRVLGVTAYGPTVADAQKRAYAAVDTIDWPEGFCRRDIGWRAIAREQNAD